MSEANYDAMDYDALDFSMLSDEELRQVLREAQTIREVELLVRVRRELQRRQAAEAAGAGEGEG
ncbi:MAG TPA: hypothetical protein VLK82_15660 [Candidatus Tectomicrobia bacterium]|nr:hypothetical protein [Candidatus Tectomicrobia bacterium]